MAGIFLLLWIHITFFFTFLKKPFKLPHYCLCACHGTNVEAGPNPLELFLSLYLHLSSEDRTPVVRPVWQASLPVESSPSPHNLFSSSVSLILAPRLVPPLSYCEECCNKRLCANASEMR